MPAAQMRCARFSFFIISLLLIAGSGESGKSTIVKQIKIIHQGGYTLDELKAWRSIVYRNLIDSAKDVISSAEKLEVSFENPRNNEVFPARLVMEKKERKRKAYVVVALKGVYARY